MKKIHYERLSSAIKSLRSSTFLKVTMRYEGIVLDNRNSPFRSRETMSLEGGHNVPMLIVLKNKDTVMAVTPGEPSNTEGCVALPGRGYMIEWIKSEIDPFKLPHWIDWNSIVFILPDYFTGYDDDGKPVFNRYIVPSFRWGSFTIHLTWDGWEDEIVERLQRLYRHIINEAGQTKADDVVRFVANEVGADEDYINRLMNKEKIVICRDGLIKALKAVRQVEGYELFF